MYYCDTRRSERESLKYHTMHTPASIYTDFTSRLQLHMNQWIHDGATITRHIHRGYFSSFLAGGEGQKFYRRRRAKITGYFTRKTRNFTCQKLKTLFLSKISGGWNGFQGRVLSRCPTKKNPAFRTEPDVSFRVRLL